MKKNDIINFFVIFKIVLSIIYAIPCALMAIAGLFVGSVAMLVPSHNIDSILTTFATTVLPIVVIGVSLILSIKSHDSINKNKYNKKYDLISCLILEAVTTIVIIVLSMPSKYANNYHMMIGFVAIIWILLAVDIIVILLSNKKKLDNNI